jgi:uncharacterized protein (TIGR00369 family)
METLSKQSHVPLKSIFDDLGKKPPAAEMVGWELIDYNKEGQWIKISFMGREQFSNPTGFVQGGFLAAMLDEVMGSAVIMVTDASYIPTTISLNVDFVRPATVGPIYGEGRVSSMGKSVAFLEGRLTDGSGQLLARSIATCKLTPMDRSWIKRRTERLLR